MRADRLLPLAILLALAACATTPPPRPAVAPPVALTPVPGLERILGRPAADAIAALGPASLDRRDGPGRGLQFAAAGCILDVYYYPDPAAGQPTARFAEARLPTGAIDPRRALLRGAACGARSRLTCRGGAAHVNVNVNQAVGASP